MLLLSSREYTPGSSQHWENPFPEHLLQTHSQNLRANKHVPSDRKCDRRKGTSPTERHEIAGTESPNPATKGEFVLGDSQLGIPHPCQPLPPKADQPLPPAQPNQLTPILLPPIPKSIFLDMPGWHCSPCSLASQSIPSLLLSHFPKEWSWRQLDVPPELSERWHSPKHHFPKHPHQQLFLTQPMAFPRAASTFFCPHGNLWGRFCKI